MYAGNGCCIVILNGSKLYCMVSIVVWWLVVDISAAYLRRLIE